MIVEWKALVRSIYGAEVRKQTQKLDSRRSLSLAINTTSVGHGGVCEPESYVSIQLEHQDCSHQTTNYMEHIPSFEANSASQKITHISLPCSQGSNMCP
jgi:hypothetical protein